jgi:hypothetical protein
MSTDNGTEEAGITAVALRAMEAPGVTAARAWLMPPANLGEAMRVAEILSESNFVPEAYYQKPGDVLCAIQYGAEIGLPPLQALQGVAVVNGRPCVYGDAALAVVLASGTVEDFREWVDGDGDKMVAHCVGKRTGRASVIEHTFSVADAKTAKLWQKKTPKGFDTPWITNPKRMLQMRARAFVLRDGWADYLKGLSIREEAQDIEVTPEAPRVEIATPKPTEPAASEAPTESPYITDAQRRELWGAMRTTGRPLEELRARLEAAGVAAGAPIPAPLLPDLMRWAKDEPADLPPSPEPGAEG